MKTPALLGTTRVMAVRGGATCGARVEHGKKRGYITNGGGAVEEGKGVGVRTTAGVALGTVTTMGVLS